MQAWWFEIPGREAAVALLERPSGVVAWMGAPSWQVNQDVDHLGAGFRVADGCLAFVAKDRRALAGALQAASYDVRIRALPAESLALCVGLYDSGGPLGQDRLVAGAMAVLARRTTLAAVPRRRCTGLTEPSTTVRQLGALIGVLPA